MYRAKSVILRALEERDLHFILEYVNDYDIYSSFTDSPPTPKSRKVQKDWMERSHPSIMTFAVHGIEKDSIVGTCQLREIDRYNGTAWLSVIIGDRDSHGKGYGSQALTLLLRYAFLELNMRKVTLRVYTDNPGAIRLYEKVGFKEEGQLKGEIYRKGAYMDQLQFSILKDEFLASGAMEKYLPEDTPLSPMRGEDMAEEQDRDKSSVNKRGVMH